MIRVTFYIHIICVVMIFLVGCSQTEDETARLLQTLTELQGQLEARESRQVLQHLDKDFLAQGRYQIAQLGQLMAFQFQQNRQIYLFLKNTEVQMRYPEADVVTTAYILGSENMLPQRGQRYEVKMRWRMVKDKWKLSRLNWQRGPVN